jgi:hypothetical protein
MNPDQLTAQERIDLLQEAAIYMDTVLELISAAVKDTPLENRAECYILPHLRDWMSVESCSITNLIEEMESLKS